MTEPGELNERVTALESSVSELRARVHRAEEDAAAARHLAGGADRDTAELRTEVREFRTEMRAFRDQNNRVLSAMRADVSDLRTDVTDLRTDLTDLREHVDRGFAVADQNFLALRGQLDGVAGFLQMIAARLPDGNGSGQPEG